MRAELLFYMRLRFNDGDGAAQQNTSGSPDIISNFTGTIKYYFTPIPGGTTYTLDTADFTEHRMNHKGTTDCDGSPTLLSQLNNLQFGNFEGSGSFQLSMNNTVLRQVP